MNYYATGKPNINVDVAERVVIGMIIGIGKGCEQSGCALIGGGGEMPSMYQGDDYSLAGFRVDVMEKPEITVETTERTAHPCHGPHYRR